MPQSTSNYKKSTPLEERKKKSFKMTSLYPDRIPVIVEMSPSSASYNTYNAASHKIKYLVPYDITMGQFIKILRDKLKLEPSIALFFFINNKVFPITSLIGNIYKENTDEDGFLYIEFCEESTFGYYI
jgi:GABA(A) receptor-associated protein